jgi:hypothetical protein
MSDISQLASSLLILKFVFCPEEGIQPYSTYNEVEVEYLYVTSWIIPNPPTPPPILNSKNY